jgi:hypothetical protein
MRRRASSGSTSSPNARELSRHDRASYECRPTPASDAPQRRGEVGECRHSTTQHPCPLRGRAVRMKSCVNALQARDIENLPTGRVTADETGDGAASLMRAPAGDRHGRDRLTGSSERARTPGTKEAPARTRLRARPRWRSPATEELQEWATRSTARPALNSGGEGDGVCGVGGERAPWRRLVDERLCGALPPGDGAAQRDPCGCARQDR